MQRYRGSCEGMICTRMRKVCLCKLRHLRFAKVPFRLSTSMLALNGVASRLMTTLTILHSKSQIGVWGEAQKELKPRYCLEKKEAGSKERQSNPTQIRLPLPIAIKPYSRQQL
jgi:hypothetical protein